MHSGAAEAPRSGNSPQWRLLGHLEYPVRLSDHGPNLALASPT